MRITAIAVSVSLALLVGPAIAKSTAPSASQTRMQTCAASWKAMTADQKKGTTYKDYSKTCLAGGSTAAAPAAAAPAATTAPAPMMAAKPAKAAKAAPAASAPAMAPTGAAPAGATGLCKDGTYTMSKTHSGSCSHHGGVAKWL